MNSVKVGREAVAHGTLAASLTAIACGFMPREKQANSVVDEVRNSQDEHFTGLRGVRSLDFDVKESAVYHDSIGLWLASALGVPTKVVVDTIFDNTFKFANDPASLSLQWDDPRRSTEPQQALNAVVDKLTIKFSADGTLTYTCSGVGMPPTAIAAPVLTFNNTKPIEAWRGAVTLDGAAAFADLVSAEITVTRGRKPFWTIRNTQDPKRMSIGKRRVEFSMVVDFDSTDEMADFRAGLATTGLLVKFADTDTVIGAASNPEFELSLDRMFYEDAEKDWTPEEPRLKITGKGLAGGAAGSTLVARVRSSRDYTV